VNVGILNISVGNIGSVASAFSFLKANISLVERPDDIKGIDLLVMAGVGHFRSSALRLRDTGFIETLNREVRDGGLPLLGICLGMQLFGTTGVEGGGDVEGLGWIPGRVVPIDKSRCKVPHMGWNSIQYSETPLFHNLNDQEVYFMHSFHFQVDDPQHVVATVDYGDQTFVSAVRRDNIFGVQFHPEKSQSAGLTVLHNFLEELQ